MYGEYKYIQGILNLSHTVTKPIYWYVSQKFYKVQMSRHSLNVHTYFVMAIDNLILIRLTSNDIDYLPTVQSWQLNIQ